MFTYIKSENAIAGPGANMLSCQRCGNRTRLTMPLPAEVAIHLMQAYAELHVYCEYNVFQELPKEIRE